MVQCTVHGSSSPSSLARAYMRVGPQRPLGPSAFVWVLVGRWDDQGWAGLVRAGPWSANAIGALFTTCPEVLDVTYFWKHPQFLSLQGSSTSTCASQRCFWACMWGPREASCGLRHDSGCTWPSQLGCGVARCISNDHSGRKGRTNTDAPKATLGWAKDSCGRERPKSDQGELADQATIRAARDDDDEGDNEVQAVESMLNQILSKRKQASLAADRGVAAKQAAVLQEAHDKVQAASEALSAAVGKDAKDAGAQTKSAFTKVCSH
ncbi:hypothetical protein HaLaN_17569 [Haematococcus lacustris]|uniref:Uncharacterized protein n=1 Tax=Haematococcus lacustris TaxID=44745 RepID=A0A699ZEY6_HAELA|nr:hypothetical protein HaLaN_17569 [Haematococcus lacustris]